MKRFSNAVGQSVSREELLKTILASGEPHPWREIWLDICRDTLLEPAEKLKHAVQAANPEIRLALMSSGVDTHGIEGRDWHQLQDALGCEPAFLTRPNLPPYTEVRALSVPPSNTRLTLACLKRPLEIYPELENSPRNGQYTKSRNFSIWECLHSVCYGADGITINHFNMLGTGISLDPSFGAALKQARKRLDTLVQLDIDDNNSEGIDVLFSPEVARHLHTGNSTTLHNLNHNTNDWSQTLFTLGIPHRFVKEIDNSRPIAVGGQTLRTLSDNDIKHLLSSTVLLDGESCDILVKKGYGTLIGVESAEWVALKDVGYSYEKILEQYSSVYGIPEPRMTAQRCSEELFEMKQSPEAMVLSMICRYDREELFPGMICFENDLGGTILSIPYPLGRLQFYMGFFNCYRRIFMQKLLAEYAPTANWVCAEDNPMHIYRVKTANGTLIAAINSTTDTAQGYALAISNPDSTSIKQLDDDGNWFDFKGKVTQTVNGFRLSSTDPIPPLDAVFLLLN